MTDTTERIRPAAAPPERIESSEAAYLTRCHATVERARAVLSSFGGYLAEKYGLGPDDRIAPDGAIMRAQGPPMTTGDAEPINLDAART